MIINGGDMINLKSGIAILTCLFAFACGTIQQNCQYVDKKVAILLHGGGFISGSADDAEMQILKDYFTGLGYQTASIPYSLCNGSSLKWPCAISSSYNDIQSVIDAGNFGEVLIVGYSAGAMAASVAVYSDPYKVKFHCPSVKFLGLEGIYNTSQPKVAPAWTAIEAACGTVTLTFSNIRNDIPSLLIEGKSDQFENYAYTDPNAHANYFNDLLVAAGNTSTVLWITGDHLTVITDIKNRDVQVCGAIQAFLGL